jgi:hypothetical protein
VEAFEITEYGRQPGEEEMRTLFPFPIFHNSDGTRTILLACATTAFVSGAQEWKRHLHLIRLLR